MNANPLRKAGKAAAATAIVLITGFESVVHMFSDLGPGETHGQRLVTLILIYSVGSVCLGLLLPGRWYLAALNSWGPLYMAGPDLQVALRAMPLRPSAFAASSIVIAFFIAPALALIAGFAGAALRRWFAQRKP